MNDYFKRLKDHPGIGVAAMLTLMVFLAVGTNKTVHSIGDVLIFGGILSSFIWMFVLISNFKRR